MGVLPHRVEEMFATLDQVQDDLTRRMVRAYKDRKSPLHTPVVVTGDIAARVMVLREFDSAAWTLRFHTDSRAPKVGVIDSDPRMSVLFYDKGAKIQIRANGTGEVLRDDLVAGRAWDRSTNFARRCYLGEGPGSASDEPSSGLPSEFEGVEPTDEQLIPARENFAVLRISLTSLDWLYLAHTGHVRAQFERSDTGWEGRWVTP
ncbi:MAG: pyridoxamine 5'-phosphate oxidase family protein [Pseudomonadota bacterium]